MFRFFLLSFWIAAELCAADLYYIAVCGASRSSEEIELALELHSRVLVKDCYSIDIDAAIKLNSALLIRFFFD